MESIFRHLTKLEEYWPKNCQWTRQQVDITLVVSSCVAVFILPLDLFSPSVHAAVIAINEAVDRGNLEITGASLRNPNALLSDLQDVQMSVYQEMLRQAKAKKKQHAANKVQLRDCNTRHRTSNTFHKIIKSKKRFSAKVFV